MADGSIYLYPSGTAKRVEATAMVVRTLAKFDHGKPAASALENVVRAGLKAYLEAGKAVAAHHNPPDKLGHKWVEANADELRQLLAPFFSPAMLNLVRDTRDAYLPYNLGGGDLTWNAYGYTVLNDLAQWGGRGLVYSSAEVTSVNPVKVLDRYAVVTVHMDVTRVFGGGQLVWDQVLIFDVHLKKAGGRWVITQRTFGSERVKGL